MVILGPVWEQSTAPLVSIHFSSLYTTGITMSLDLFWNVRNDHNHLKNVTIFPVLHVYSKLIKKSITNFVNCIFRKVAKIGFSFPFNVTMVASYNVIGSQECMV